MVVEPVGIVARHQEQLLELDAVAVARTRAIPVAPWVKWGSVGPRCGGCQAPATSASVSPLMPARAASRSGPRP